MKNNLKVLPDNLKAKAGELTSDEIIELGDLDVSKWNILSVMKDSDSAFRAAITLLEYRGIKKRTWAKIDSGVILAYLITVNNATYSSLNENGELKKLPAEFKDLDNALTGGEKFDLYEKFEVMSLEKVPTIDEAYDFLASSRNIKKIDFSKLPLYSKELFVGWVAMGNFPVQKDFLTKLQTS